jgi:predicted 3-demethylubiquinone-9 3-methyltransferase (glyoxalase superfamily)
MISVLPFLMFQGDAGPALDLYMSVFPNSRIDEIDRYGAGEPGPEGTIKRARFTLGQQSVLCIDSPIKHAFTFTPSFSFFVECGSEEELRRLHGRLSKGGGELMPIADYGFSRLFAWINDPFGVSWQLNLA